MTTIKACIKRPQWLYLIFGFIAITLVVYALSFFINDKIDWRILLFLNPDSAIPVVDDLMILITDYSLLGYGVVFFFWEIGYQASKRTRITKENTNRALKIIGLVLSVVACTAYFWAGYAHPMIFMPLAIIVIGSFWLIGNSMTLYDDEKLNQISCLFWLTLLSGLLAELAAEGIIKDIVGRPRPLSEAYSVYNAGIRIVADEVVMGGHSYVAGHSTVFFAMVTPMIYFASKNRFKAGLFVWASVHSFSRVYLAAHFPYCSLVGSLLGFSMATLIVMTFGAMKLKNK